MRAAAPAVVCRPVRPRGHVRATPDIEVHRPRLTAADQDSRRARVRVPELHRPPVPLHQPPRSHIPADRPARSRLRPCPARARAPTRRGPTTSAVGYRTPQHGAEGERAAVAVSGGRARVYEGAGRCYAGPARGRVEDASGGEEPGERLLRAKEPRPAGGRPGACGRSRRGPHFTAAPRLQPNDPRRRTPATPAGHASRRTTRPGAGTAHAVADVSAVAVGPRGPTPGRAFPQGCAGSICRQWSSRAIPGRRRGRSRRGPVRRRR